MAAEPLGKSIIIVGGGPGGYETALEAAARGFDVTLVTDGELGGTCLNEGCIPTKTLCRSAEFMLSLREGSKFGVDVPALPVDWQKVYARKDEVVGKLRSGVEFLLGGAKVSVVRARAVLCSGRSVTLSSPDPALDGKELGADYVILATGSHSASLPIPGADLPGVVTSRELLSLGGEPPRRLCIIGGGVIGLEFASVFEGFGSEVTVLEYCKEILPRFDTDLAKRLRLALGKGRGIRIETAAQVTAITGDGEGGPLAVSFLRKGKEESVECDTVLMAVGRVPNVEGIGLEDVGVQYTRRGVAVDQDMRTNIGTVYAIGDVTGGIMLAHAATFQGLKALEDICSREKEGYSSRAGEVDLTVIPAAVFTIPEAATVGLTEDECKEKGIAVSTRKAFFRANGKALSMGEEEGYCKIVADKSTGRILGCHLFGPHSSDLVHEVSLLMKKGGTLDDIRFAVHAHPSLSEVILSAAKG